ncbi:hypothetical protein ACO22_08164, partial [Paracoccidioides brasiliensis]
RRRKSGARDLRKEALYGITSFVPARMSTLGAKSCIMNVQSQREGATRAGGWRRRCRGRGAGARRALLQTHTHPCHGLAGEESRREQRRRGGEAERRRGGEAERRRGGQNMPSGTPEPTQQRGQKKNKNKKGERKKKVKVRRERRRARRRARRRWAIGQDPRQKAQKAPRAWRGGGESEN